MSATQRQKADRTKPRPYWPSVTDETLFDEVKLARVMAAMGFTMSLGTSRRGNIAWWQPAYLRRKPWRARAAEGDIEWQRAYRAGKLSDAHIAGLDAWDDREREAIANLNRATRDAAVLIMARPKPVPLGMPSEYDCYAIDLRSGEWTGTAYNASQRGDDLISLGMVIWQCAFPQAAGRIARAAGFEIPRIIYG